VKDDSSSGEEDSDQEVAFAIRNLSKFMKKKGHQKKKRFCYGCGQTGHFIAECHVKDKNKYNKNNDKKYKGKKNGEAHLGEEWESNDSDSSDDDEKKKKGATNIAIHHSSSPIMNLSNKASPPKLFPNLDSSSSLFSNLMTNDLPHG